MNFRYPVRLSRSPDGRFLVTFPDLPEALTDGGDRAEALAEAADCLEEALFRRIREGEVISGPSPARGRPLVSAGATVTAKAALYLAMHEARISKVALAQRLGCDEKVVRRLLDPAHPSKISSLEQALAALGQRLEVRVRRAA